MLIPNAVRATVLGRIRQMERLERSILMSASAIGRRFEFSVLAATVTCADVRVRAALERACALQLIEAEGQSGSRYTFRHALTRDIVYAELLTVSLRPVHRRIVRALERAAHSGDAALLELAHHAWAAGDPRRALRYNERAGDAAAAVDALDDARIFYDRAQGLLHADSAAFVRLAAKLGALCERQSI